MGGGCSTSFPFSRDNGYLTIEGLGALSALSFPEGVEIMAKAIEWSRGRYSKKRAEKVIRAFNSARERALRSDALTEYDKQYIPDRVNLSTLAGATSTKDRDRMLDYLNFVKGGISVFKQEEVNPHGVTLSRYQKNVVEKQLNYLNRARKSYRKELFGKDTNENTPDYYKKEEFNILKFRSQRQINTRLEAIADASDTSYIALRRDEYLRNYEKSLKSAYGEETGTKIMENIRKNRTPQEIERILYNNEIEDPDDNYVVKNVKEEQTKFISRIETAFNFSLGES